MRAQTTRKQTFTELMEAERNGNGKSDGTLFEALTRWVMCTQPPWANQLAHVRFTPTNNPGCDLWGYRRSDFTKIDVECKDYFDRTLQLDQVRGLATQNRGGRDKILGTSASKLASEVEKTCKEHNIAVFDRTYFERLGKRIGGFPTREKIMAFSEEPIPSGPVTLLPHQVELSDKLTEVSERSEPSVPDAGSVRGPGHRAQCEVGTRSGVSVSPGGEARGDSLGNRGSRTQDNRQPAANA